MATHYYAKTTYRANYFYWLLYALSIIASHLLLRRARLLHRPRHGAAFPSVPLTWESVPPRHHMHRRAAFRCNLPSAFVASCFQAVRMRARKPLLYSALHLTGCMPVPLRSSGVDLVLVCSERWPCGAELGGDPAQSGRRL